MQLFCVPVNFVKQEARSGLMREREGGKKDRRPRDKRKDRKKQ